ncbi:MAG: 1-acyl-sn-glycerol-3-phosphate acyltransferase [Oscillospiraceae bacterium]|nr:1-acyl-sn-glycerol-3-phosphate acyltransferase [Oscillospiraceae bacterium]
MFFKFARDFTKIFLSIWFDICYINKKPVGEGVGCILACNHVKAIDPLLLAYGIDPEIHYMGKKELFQNPILGMLFRAINAFAVDRGAGDAGALDHAVKLIEENKIMGIFPEGTRSKTGELLRGKSGMAVIASRTKASILPAAVYYPNGCGFRAKAYVCYGEMLPYESFNVTDASPAQIKGVTKKVMGEIAALRQKCIDRWERDGMSK